jgi:AraC-like DNA-binding protein
MLTKESIYVIFFSLPVYQLLFYTVQLVSFKRTNPSKKYLGLLLLCMTGFLVANAVHFLGYDNLFSYIYFIYLPLLLSIAPAYFLYMLSITQENHDVKKRERLILFTPAILMLIANILFLSSMGQDERMSMLAFDIRNYDSSAGANPALLMIFWIAGTILVFGQLAFAVSKVTRIMLKEAAIMQQQPSHLAYLEWNWIIGISLSALVFLVINVLVEMIVPMNYLGIVIIYNFLMLLTGGVTGYLGMKQDTLLNQVEKISVAEHVAAMENISPKTIHKVETTAGIFMSSVEAEDIHKRILEYLEIEKPYIRSDFSMHDLCDKLNISRRKISYVLNEVIEKNFYGVVNEFRIREAQELLLKSDLNLMKIEVLGEMVGFQSKSSFNACFKKLTGMTPSEYRAMKKGA